MDQKAIERILLVLIWLTTGVRDAFSQDAVLSVGSEPSISTTAISDSRNSTEQQQTNNEITTPSMLSSSSTATDAATSASSSNENDNDTRTYSSTAAAAAAVISIGSNATDAPSSAVASSSNGSSDAASNSPVISASSTTTTTYATESLANANTYMADSQNSTTTERESNAIAAESNGETHDNRTGSGTEGSSWSSGTTQEGGNGVDDRPNGVVEAGVSSKEQDPFPGDTGSWNNSTVAISDNSDTTTQQQTNNEMTTTLQMLGSETEVAMATGNSSNSNEAIITRPTEDYDVFASTPSSSSPAAAAGGDGGGAAANFSGSDAASNIPTINASFSTEAFTNANTPASVPNSTTTEPDSNATDSASNAQNHDNATAFGTDGYNWSSATTQARGGGGGGGGGDGGDGAATGAQVSLGAEDPSQVDQGSWSSTTGNSNSTVQQQTNSEIMTTAAQMLGIGAESNISGTAAATTDITLSSTSAAAGPAVADTPPFSASSDALNQSNYFTNANTLASVLNSTTTEPDSNATDSASDAQNHDNATAFGTDGYNWSSATTQARGGGGGGDGGDGVVTTGVGVALGAENPFPGESGSWNSTTAILASDDNTTLHPGEALPPAPIDNNTVATTPASSTNDTFASSPPPPPPPPPPSSAPSTANSSDAAQNFSTDGALYTSYTTGYFTNANSSNSLETATVPNTMVNASEVQLNGSDFGTDKYNWSSVTEQSSGSADGGGGGGGGNWSNSSVSVTSNSTAENQTADIATTSSSSSSSSSSYRTILCYNCSGNNCSETDNDTATCASSTGTCYIQYDAVATALSFSCAPLLSSSNGCPGAYATRAARTVCEMCCTAPFCNSKSSSEMEQMCSQQLRSSVDPIGGGGGGRGRVYQLALAALIAAIRYCTFGTASCFFGDW